MSFLGKVFGGKPKEQAPTTEQAIQKLKEIEDMLGKKQEHLEKKIENELLTARKAGTKNKRVALEALKRKKRMEKQLHQIDGTLTTIEFQREALENAATNTEVLKIMGFASKALESAHKGMTMEDVEDIMDDIQEQITLADEIGQAFSQPIGFADDIDEDELLDELEELEAEKFAEEFAGSNLPSVNQLPDLPVVEPKRPTAKHKAEENDDMEELAQWAS